MEQQLFHTWSTNKEKEKVFNQIYKDMENSQGSSHYTKGSDRFKDIQPNISIRDGFTRDDYDYFREDEAISGDHKTIKRKCRQAYRKVGLVKNIVDLMSDFTVQGMRIVHPVGTIQNFFETWADKVNMVDRSERIANNLIKQGVFALQRTTAKLNDNDVNNFKKGLVIGSDINADTEISVNPSTVPYKYTFLNPASLDIIGDDLAVFSNNVQYGVNIPPLLASRIKSPKNDSDKKFVSSLPRRLVNLVRDGERFIPLEQDKTVVGHYKKDDYEPWADSMLYSVLDDIIMLNKMKLADISALDGAISHIRLWRLGSLEHKIAPNPAGLAKLSDILLNSVAGGCVDLVWGPELDFKETSSDIYKFLGQEKYAPVLNSIYAGLGIPQTLTGGTGASGTTNNYISLKTLLERLNYIRGIIINFWNNEIRRIQKAMGFAKPALIEFNRMTLSDEASEKAMIIQMVDRDIISIETAQERMGENPELEELRRKKEAKKRKKGKMPLKAGPYHDANHKEAMQKIVLQNGSVTPSEVGLELEDKASGETSVLDKNLKAQKEQSKIQQKTSLPDVAGKGRPKNANDTKKRKKKKFLPRTAATLTTTFAWARKAQGQIADFMDKTYVKCCGKENMRQLSTSEAKDLEDLKFATLCSFNVTDNISTEAIEASLDKELCIPNHVQALCQETINKYQEKTSGNVSLDEVRQIQAMAYVFYKGDFNG